MNLRTTGEQAIQCEGHTQSYGPDKPTIVTFGLCVPIDNPDNAGAVYVRDLLLSLSKLARVILVVDLNEENSGILERFEMPNVEVIRVARPRWSHTILGRVVRRILRNSPIPDVDLAFRRQVRQHPAVKQAVQTADVVDLQWFDLFCFAKTVRSWNDNCQIIGTAHDVIHVRDARLRRSGIKIRVRPVERLQNVVTKSWERRRTRHLTAVVVFSDEDARNLHTVGVTTPIQVIRPSLQKFDSVEDVPARYGSTVTFVGNFARSENNQAALWLIRDIWPKVRSGNPAARLLIAGARPSRELVQESKSDTSIKVTGFVDDLDNVYRVSSVIVAPLLAGAGVKFKVITGMMWARPIVCTPIAAEGIAPMEYFWSVSAEANLISRAIITALTDRRAADEIARKAFHLAVEQFGNTQYQQNVNRVYLNAASAPCNHISRTRAADRSNND